MATYATYDLQEFAIGNGWDPSIASSLEVKYTKDKLFIDIPSDIKQEVENIEYGTESRRPNAVLRKYDNRAKQLEQVFIKQFEKELGVKL